MRFARFGIAPWTAPLLIWLTSGCALEAPPNNDVLATNDQAEGGDSSGSSSISFTEIPPSATLVFSVNDFGTFDPHTGRATISGTYTCNGESFGVVVAPLLQHFGPFTASGTGISFPQNPCDGEPHSWSVVVGPQTGRFSGGKAIATITVFGDVTEGFDKTVQLRGGPQ